jgi:hypothetical protein
MPEIPAADMSRLLVIARLVAHDDLVLANQILKQIGSEEAVAVGKGLLGMEDVRGSDLQQLLKRLRVKLPTKNRAKVPA